MPQPKKKPAKTPGPVPEVLKIDGNWEDAVRKAMTVKRPPGGWPKPPKTPSRKPKTK